MFGSGQCKSQPAIVDQFSLIGNVNFAFRTKIDAICHGPVALRGPRFDDTSAMHQATVPDPWHGSASTWRRSSAVQKG